ncbi:PREDICTED: L10-interacting MYB domain-containing protein-like [Nicotiana attenuata]|uniref:L10-interacting MYB domain-containing protein-like n=1 Tax=Nicotiana attenuata TaxID=49451 RepID=UPI000904909F|nr:PREDICTED: L10-interacting MYB domain-containing protein-like [Nicotiana attenuata]
MSKKVTQDNNSEKAKWDAEITELFLNLCVEEIIAGNRLGTHFSRIGWSNLVQKFNAKTGKNYDKTKLKNKWDSFKLIWKDWDTLVGKETGLGWDCEKKTVQASVELWSRKIKENPNVEKFRDKGLQCRELMEICFKDVVATGEHAWAPSSGVLPDSILGREGLDHINLEEPEVTEKRDTNESGDKTKKRKASSITTEKEKSKVSTSLRITSSIERIAEAVELRSAIIVRSKDTPLSIKSVMDVVRNLPGMIMSLNKHNNDNVDEEVLIIGDDIDDV